MLQLVFATAPIFLNFEKFEEKPFEFQVNLNI